MAKKKASKAKGTKKAKKSASSGMEMLLVSSKTREALKKYDVNVAGDALEGLNGWLHWLIAQAAQRAQSNGRKTVRSHDFIVM